MRKEEIEKVSQKVNEAVEEEVARLRILKTESQAEEQRIKDQQSLAHLYWKKGTRTVDNRVYTAWLWGYLANDGKVEYVSTNQSAQLTFQRLDPRKRKHKLTGIEGPWTLVFVPEGTDVEIPEDRRELKNCVFFDFNGFQLIRSPDCEFKVTLFQDTRIQMMGMASLLSSGGAPRDDVIRFEEEHGGDQD